jgi:hypothetical protein
VLFCPGENFYLDKINVVVRVIVSVISYCGKVVLSISSLSFVFFDSAINGASCLSYVAFPAVAFYKVYAFCLY